jgi:hypothetical protein
MMDVITNEQTLQAAISAQEQVVKNKLQQLNNSFNAAASTIAPSNLVKDVLFGFANSGASQQGSTNVALASGAGWVAKKLIQGKSTNIFRRIMGGVAQWAVTASLIKKTNNHNQLNH